MNAEPVQWSAEKQQRLQERLVGSWEGDVFRSQKMSQKLLTYLRSHL